GRSWTVDETARARGLGRVRPGAYLPRRVVPGVGVLHAALLQAEGQGARGAALGDPGKRSRRSAEFQRVPRRRVGLGTCGRMAESKKGRGKTAVRYREWRDAAYRSAMRAHCLLGHHAQDDLLRRICGPSGAARRHETE